MRINLCAGHRGGNDEDGGNHGDDHSGHRHDPRRRADDDRLFGGLGEARRIGDHLADLDPTIEIDFMPETFPGYAWFFPVE
jgi:hypothetical protein